MQVHSVLQRVGVAAVAPAGALYAGVPQWLGLALVPMHDGLSEAAIQVIPSLSVQGMPGNGLFLFVSKE